MTKSILFWLLATFLLITAPAEAQEPEKIYRVGFLTARSAASATDPHRVAFRERLRELGYVEGVNVVIEYRASEGKRQRSPDLAAELVRLKVDVIVTGAGPGSDPCCAAGNPYDSHRHGGCQH